MAPKRKAAEAEIATEDEPQQPSNKSTASPEAQEAGEERKDEASFTSSQEPSTTNATNSSSSDARAARFAALKARAASSSASNLTAARQEASRSAIDPSQLASLSRRHAIASHNLLKAEHESAEAFERKRAWDWTMDESERWDRRMAKKEKHREEVGFRNYGDEAGKVYRRQLRDMAKQDAKTTGGEPSSGPADRSDDEDRLSAYEQSKIRTLVQAAQNGGLEIVEAPDGSGELVLLDRHGTYTTPGSLDASVPLPTSHTPSRSAVDRLVSDLRKAEEARLRKRRGRSNNDDDADAGGDVTYINDKNKAFNMKLRRFYDRYTREIRDGFERGTAI